MVALPITEPKSIQDKIKAYADLIGEDEDRVRAVDLNAYRMSESGVYVDVDLCGFSMFTVRASDLDLGISREDMRGKYITRGVKHLVPEEYVKALRNIDSRFRQSLIRNSFDVKGPWRWVPHTAYQRWKEEWAEIDADLEALKAKMLAEYDDIKARLAEIYAEIGGEAWEARMARGAGEDLPEDLRTREAYVARVVESVLSRLPGEDDIRDGIYATYYNARMMTLADAEEDRVATAQREAERSRVQAEEEKERRLILADARERELEVQEREIQIQAMHDAEMEHAREQIARDGSMYRGIFDQYRAMIYDAATSVRAAIEKHGYLPGATAKKAQGMREVFAALNGHRDREMDEVLAELEAIMERRVPHPERKNDVTYDVDAVAEQLELIASMTVESAQAMARAAGGTRAGALMVDF